MQNFLTKGSVCFVTLNMGYGGAEKVIATLSNEFIQSGREVTILTFIDHNDFTHILDSRIKLQTLSINNFKMSFFALCKFIYKNRFDNFIVNIWPLTVFSFLIRLVSPNTNLVYIEHCILTEQYRDKNILFKILKKISITIFYRFAHHIISVSEGVKNDLISLGAPKNKISVIYNPLMPNLVNAKNFLNRDILSWMKGDHINLIAVGKLKKAKNFINLIKSIELLVNKSKKKVRLTILGDGAERAAMDETIKRYNLENYILLPGWVDDPIPYLRLSDLFILSSDYEGFGLVILEALSVGVNVVSTDCKTGPSEILRNGEFGFLCKVDDVQALASSINTALNEPLPKNILMSRALDFSPEQISHKYEQVLI